MSRLQAVDGQDYKYSHLVGTGGIGSGMFFQLEGNHTLGRNESRPGELLPVNDYCKLHIIIHYVSVLLGAKEDQFKVYPIGKVGDDSTGKQLINDLEEAGMQLNGVDIEPDFSTLFSVCFQYPDSTGGNITTSNSASSQVIEKDIDRFFLNFKEDGAIEMILAVPEVPIATRIKLLEKGRERGSFNIASVLSSEVEFFRNRLGFQKTDLLAINIDEARAIAGFDAEEQNKEKIIEECIEKLTKINGNIIIIITAGPDGSYCYDRGRLTFVPSLKTEAAGTGGAGDSFLAGIITGINCGLPLVKEEEDEYFGQTPLDSAAELATLVASLGITSPDTIHRGLTPASLLEYTRKRSMKFSPQFKRLWRSLC